MTLLKRKSGITIVSFLVLAFATPLVSGCSSFFSDIPASTSDADMINDQATDNIANTKSNNDIQEPKPEPEKQQDFSFIDPATKVNSEPQPPVPSPVKQTVTKVGAGMAAVAAAETLETAKPVEPNVETPKAPAEVMAPAAAVEAPAAVVAAPAAVVAAPAAVVAAPAAAPAAVVAAPVTAVAAPAVAAGAVAATKIEKERQNSTATASGVMMEKNQKVSFVGPVPPNRIADHYTVQKGDNIYAISRHFVLPIAVIAYTNRLKEPYRLTIGMKLIIPHPQLYKVEAGDTLFSVARKFNADQAAIMRMNQLVPPYEINVDSIIALPDPLDSTQYPDPIISTGMSAGNPNLAKPESTLPKGQGMGDGAKGDAAKKVPTGNSKTTAPSTTATIAPVPKTTATVPPVTAPAKTASPKTPASNSNNQKATETPIRSSKFYSWPVRGRVESGYNEKVNGVVNTGINILSPIGTPVLAAESGKIIYAEPSTDDMGKLIIILHSDGSNTAYGHLNSIKVKSGDKVWRGQAIGTVGNSGTVKSPQLFFQVRKNNRETVNPLTQLEK